MKSLQFALLLILSFGAFAQSKSTKSTSHFTRKSIYKIPCQWNAIVEKREKVNKNTVNVLVFLTGFNTTNELCWDDLPEYYYNIVPEPGIKTQCSYFVVIPKGANITAIKTLRELKAAPFKVIGVYQYDTLGLDKFVRFPFENKSSKK